MFLNFYLEHPMSLKNSIPYSQFLRLKRIHNEPQYLLETLLHMYFFFTYRENPHDTLQRAWMKTKNVTLSPKITIQDTDIPIMFLTSYMK